MNILLIGDFFDNFDKGMKKITYNIFNNLSKTNMVMLVKPLEILYKKREINKFNPNIVHYIMSPSIYSFILLKLAKMGLKKAKTVISVTHPHNLKPKVLIKYPKPDLILVQAYDMELLFKRVDMVVDYRPNGINTEEFKPVNNKSMKVRLREKYDIDNGKFVVLHVGNIQSGRNLYLLEELSKSKDIQVLIVASTTIRKNEKIFNKLLNSEIKIINYYVKNMEDIYNLSDVYVFPVTNRPYAIDIPLSVTEDMACNLPVVSTRFAGLPIFFSEGIGLFYADSKEDIIECAFSLKDKIIDDSLEIKTREKILPFSWEKVCKRLESAYIRLLREGR